MASADENVAVSATVIKTEDIPRGEDPSADPPGANAPDAAAENPDSAPGNDNPPPNQNPAAGIDPSYNEPPANAAAAEYSAPDQVPGRDKSPPRRSSSSSRPSAAKPSSEPDRARGPLNENWKFFLANLPPSVTAGEMRRHFEAYGEVNYVKLIYNKTTGISMGYGFLYLMDEATDRRVEEYAARNNYRIRFANFSRIYLQRNDRSRARPLRFKSSHDENVPQGPSSGRYHHGPRQGRDGPPRGGNYGHYGHQGGPPPQQRGAGYYGRDHQGRDGFQDGPPRQHFAGNDRGQQFDRSRGPGDEGHYNGPPEQQYHQGGNNSHYHDSGYNNGPPSHYADNSGFGQDAPPAGNHSNYPPQRDAEGGYHGQNNHQPYPDQRANNWDNGYGNEGNYPPQHSDRGGPPGQYGAPRHEEDHGRQPTGPPAKHGDGYDYSEPLPGANNPPSQNGYHGYPQGGEQDRHYSQGGENGDYGYSQGPPQHQQGPPPQQLQHGYGGGGNYSNEQDYGYSQASDGPHGYSQRNPEGFSARGNNDYQGGGDHHPPQGNYNDQRNYNNQGYDQSYQDGPLAASRNHFPADNAKGYSDSSWNEGHSSHNPQGVWSDHQNGNPQSAPPETPSHGIYGPGSAQPQHYSHGGKGRGGGAANSQRYHRRDRPY